MSLLYTTYYLSNLNVNLVLSGIIFCATLFVYTFQRLIKLKTRQAFSEDRKVWMIKNKPFVLILLVTSFILLCILSFYIPIKITIYLVLIGLISVFYVGFFWIKNKKGLRDIPFIKVYLVAFVWTMLLTVIPVYNSNKEFSGTETALSVAFFLYILAMAVLFDIKDISIDDHQKRTIPKIAGIKNTQRLSLLLTGISMSIMICFYSNIIWYVLLLFTLSGMVIYHAPKWTKEFQYSLFIDGVLYLPGIMALISVIF